MINHGKVQSTMKPNEIEIDEYSVWVNTDIKRISIQHEGVLSTAFEFNQIQYSKDEYINLIDKRNKVLDDKLTDTQLALCDVYEFVTAASGI